MITEESSPKAPIMVIAFAGWNDAGGASTWAIRSLLEKTIATEILTFDSEDYYDFSIFPDYNSIEVDIFYDTLNCLSMYELQNLLIFFNAM